MDCHCWKTISSTNDGWKTGHCGERLF